MENNRNFFITIAISVAILALWQVFFMQPRIDAQRHAQQTQTQATGSQPAQQKTAEGGTAQDSASQSVQPNGSAPAAGNVPGNQENAPGQAASEQAAVTAALAEPRVKIDTPNVRGSIALKGARLDDLFLKQYHDTVDKNSPDIQLFAPAASPLGYFAELGYAAGTGTGALPGPDTVWTVDGNAVLTPKTPVTLTYTNDKGLTFKRVISVDDEYMFSFHDTVVNNTGAPVTLSSYGRITKFWMPETRTSYLLHEGMIGELGNGGLEEIKYDKMKKDKEVVSPEATGGWLGITDKYWAAALVPPQTEAYQPRFSYFDNGRARWQADFLSKSMTIAPGQSQTVDNRIFAGAKQNSILNNYESQGISKFSLLIDWGWFFFITKPMFYFIDWLYKFTGNFGVAILLVTVTLKAIFFPLANKSYTSMARMKKVQPMMAEIRERFPDDKMKQQQAMMELYKREKINPVAGCWPMVIQIPVFFALYKTLYVTIEMRHAPFFGWIRDLAAPDPTSVFNLFGLIHYPVPHYLMIGAWPLIMGVTMFLQMRMNPTPPDPTQQMIFTWMPVVFTFMLSAFPAGLVIYWAWNNTLSVIQQSIIMKRQGVKVELWENTKSLFKRRSQPAE
jgi:YidC/Oxa1 family membrane protein insertase